VESSRLLQSIAADRILLLDSFFTVVIFHGTSVAQWRKANYHEQVSEMTVPSPQRRLSLVRRGGALELPRARGCTPHRERGMGTHRRLPIVSCHTCARSPRLCQLRTPSQTPDGQPKARTLADVLTSRAWFSFDGVDFLWANTYSG
jgi:hypothetical protein